MVKPISARLPHDGHEKHLCYLVNLQVNLTELKKITKNGNFICKNFIKNLLSDYTQKAAKNKQ